MFIYVYVTYIYICSYVSNFLPGAFSAERSQPSIPIGPAECRETKCWI